VGFFVDFIVFLTGL